MIASAHIAAGVVIGVASARFLRWRAGRIVAAFGLGMILHLAMDAIPHGDYRGLLGVPLLIVVAIESMVAITMAFVLLRERVTPGWVGPVFAGVVGSALPDAKFVAPLVLPADYARAVTAWGERLHDSIHAAPTSFAVGMTTQLVATLLFFVMLAAFPRTRGG